MASVDLTKNTDSFSNSAFEFMNLHSCSVISPLLSNQTENFFMFLPVILEGVNKIWEILGLL